MRKMLIFFVVFLNVKVSVVLVLKMVKVFYSLCYEGVMVMFLFENLFDIIFFIEVGVLIKIVNVGGMCFENYCR